MNNLIKLIEAANQESEVITLLKTHYVFDFVRNYLMANYDIDWTGDRFIDEHNILVFDLLKEDIILAIRASIA